MSYMDLIKECQAHLAESYPDLKVRWARIYGKRWSHLYGDSNDLYEGSPLKIEIKPSFGLFIDNSEVISAQELDQVVATIKERFNHVDLV